MIDELVKTFQDRLPDDFSRQVLSGAVRVLQDDQNPIRLNLFACAVRELFTYVLHALAPDDQIRGCPWFPPQREQRARSSPHLSAADLDRPTRRQRALYAVQGGLADEQIREYGADVEGIHDELLEAMDELSKVTHVRPGTLIRNTIEIRKFATSVLSAMVGFYDALDHCRGIIADSILEQVHEVAFEELTRETIDDLDVLSTHTAVDGPTIDNVDVVSISAQRINYLVTGSVEVTLNYGSSRDRSRGEGASIHDSYPFRLAMNAPIDKPEAFENVECNVDTSDFYE